MYASQEVQVSCSLLKPKTNFLHHQGHQRACEITGLINIIQITNCTIHEVDNQSQLTQKIAGKRTRWFSEVTQI